MSGMVGLHSHDQFYYIITMNWIVGQVDPIDTLVINQLYQIEISTLANYVTLIVDHIHHKGYYSIHGTMVVTTSTLVNSGNYGHHNVLCNILDYQLLITNILSHQLWMVSNGRYNQHKSEQTRSYFHFCRWQVHITIDGRLMLISIVKKQLVCSGLCWLMCFYYKQSLILDVLGGPPFVRNHHVGKKFVELNKCAKDC